MMEADRICCGVAVLFWNVNRNKSKECREKTGVDDNEVTENETDAKKGNDSILAPAYYLPITRIVILTKQVKSTQVSSSKSIKTDSTLQQIYRPAQQKSYHI